MRAHTGLARGALLGVAALTLLFACAGPALADGAAIASATVSLRQSALTANLHNAPSDVIVPFEGTVHISTDFGHWVHLDLSVIGTAWPVSLSVTTIARQTDADVPFSGSVSVPRGAAEATYSLAVRAHDGDSLSPIDTQAPFTVSVFRGLIAVSADLTSAPLQAGGTAHWDITIKNLDSVDLAYEVEVTVPAGFTFVAHLPGTQIVAASREQTFDLAVSAPTSAGAGDFEWSLTVTSTGGSTAPATMKAPFEVSRIVAPAPPGTPDFLATYWLPISFGLAAAGIVAYFSLTEVGYLALSFSVLVPLFTRIRKERVLDNFTRGQIYGYIQANPGAHYSAIQQVLDIENGVMAYHLRVLMREDFVVARNEGVYKRFYPRDYRIPKGRTLLTRLQVDILEAIERSPGLTQREVARELGESKQVISYNVGVLRDAGLLSAERRGRDMVLRPSSGTATALAEGDDFSAASPGPSDLAPL